MAPIPTPEVSLYVPNSTVGAVEIGLLIGAFLFGLVTCQSDCFCLVLRGPVTKLLTFSIAYIYYQKFPADAPLLKLLVAVIWCVARHAFTGNMQV